jgi:hypothetical protein
VRKFDEVTDRGANAVKALYAGLDVPPPFFPYADAKAGLKEGGGVFADGGGRGGSEEGGCGVEEEGLGPGGGGKDMMNGCPEEKVGAISNVPVDCKKQRSTRYCSLFKHALLNAKLLVLVVLATGAHGISSSRTPDGTALLHDGPVIE